jgi:hypothetical protein
MLRSFIALAAGTLCLTAMPVMAQTDAAAPQADTRHDAYAAALAKAQVACTFDQAAHIGADTATGRDVVEFHCAEKPNGLVAMIPGATSNAPFESFDCFSSHVMKLSCRLTSDETLLTHLKTAAKASPQIKPDCDLAQVRYGFMTKTDAIVMELACVNKRGYIAVLNAARTGFNPAVSCDAAAKSDKVPEKCQIDGNGTNTAS